MKLCDKYISAIEMKRFTFFPYNKQSSRDKL